MQGRRIRALVAHDCTSSLQATQQRQPCVAQVATSVEDEASAEVDRLDGGQLSAEIDAATRYLDRGKGSDGEPISIRYCVLGRGSEGLNGCASACASMRCTYS